MSRLPMNDTACGSRRCHNCTGRFGMVRWYTFQLIGGTLQFCSSFCKAEHARKQEAECARIARERTFHDLLYRA